MTIRRKSTGMARLGSPPIMSAPSKRRPGENGLHGTGSPNRAESLRKPARARMRRSNSLPSCRLCNLQNRGGCQGCTVEKGTARRLSVYKACKRGYTVENTDDEIDSTRFALASLGIQSLAGNPYLAAALRDEQEMKHRAARVAPLWGMSTEQVMEVWIAYCQTQPRSIWEIQPGEALSSIACRLADRPGGPEW